MILRRILVVFFSLTRASNATSSCLAEDVSRLSINDTNSIEVAGFSEPLLTLEDIISQGDELRASTLNDDIETVVSKLDQQLLNLLELGVAPLDVTPMINCFPFAAEELVLAAQNVQAYILLKLLQMIYIWRDDAQFHWFQALSFNSPWYDKDMWNTYPMDWDNNLDAICAHGNGDLVVMLQKKISSEAALNAFNKSLVLQCARDDAIKVFEATRMDPIMLEEYLGIMAGCGSIRLLRFYQSSLKVEHLHLERFPFLGRLPTSADDFAFLMNHGFECFPMGQFIKRFCKEGRLDLLVYLYELEPKLIPYKEDLMLAAENGWLDILQWGIKLIRKWQISKSLAVKLAVNDHFKALDWLVNECELIIDDEIIKEVVIAGRLKALQWMYEKQPFGYKAEWITLGVENHHLPILKWLSKTFNYIPSAFGLSNATAEILDWRKARNVAFSYEDLVKNGAGNFELLQWAHKNAPISIFNGMGYILSLATHNRGMMEWLYDTLKIHPVDMNWAYIIGDLEAIQWALKICRVIPKVENIVCAIEKGRLNIIKWIHENYPKYLRMLEAVKLNKCWGSMEMVDYVVSNFKLCKALNFGLDHIADWNHRLDILKWIHERGHSFDGSLTKEMDKFIANGQLQSFLNFRKAFPEIQPSRLIWYSVAKYGHHKIYKWHLDNCPLMYLLFELKDDIQVAFVNGHLEIVKLILHKYPAHYEDISKLKVTRSNYHIIRWLDINFNS